MTHLGNLTRYRTTSVGNAASGRGKTLGDDHQIAWLLQFYHEEPCAYRVRNATIYKDEVSRSDWDSVKEGENRIVLDRI